MRDFKCDKCSEPVNWDEVKEWANKNTTKSLKCKSCKKE